MKILTLCTVGLIAIASISGMPAEARTAYNLGNLYGAAERCGFTTVGLPYRNGNAFQNARNTARNSRQDCQMVRRTARQVRYQQTRYR
jgi:hypothetical protein